MGVEITARSIPASKSETDLKAVQTMKGFVFRIDRQQFTGKFPFNKVCHDCIADGAGFFTCSYNGDVLGFENAV